MQYKLFDPQPAKQQAVRQSTVQIPKRNEPKMATETKVVRSIDTKDILLVILCVLLIVAIVFWFIASNEISELRTKQIELNQQLLEAQEQEATAIKGESKKTDFRIEVIEERRTRNLENEKTIIDNPVSLDARAAEQFFTEYEPYSADTIR